MNLVAYLFLRNFWFYTRTHTSDRPLRFGRSGGGHARRMQRADDRQRFAAHWNTQGHTYRWRDHHLGGLMHGRAVFVIVQRQRLVFVRVVGVAILLLQLLLLLWIVQRHRRGGVLALLGPLTLLQLLVLLVALRTVWRHLFHFGKRVLRATV